MVARVDWNGTTIWYGDDVQGSVRLLWDRSGTIVGSRSFNGFGQILSESGTKLDRYAYTGREWDAALGLQYTRARMYDPSTGRFLSEDPLGQYAGDVNVYRYVGNSPFAASDPSGQLAWFAPIIIGAGIGAAANYGYYAYKNWGNQSFDGAMQAIARGGIAGAYGGLAFYGITNPALGAFVARPIFGAIADGIVGGGLLNYLNGEDPFVGAAFGGAAGPLGYVVGKAIASRVGKYCAARFAKPKEFPSGADKIYNVTNDINKIISSGRVWGNTEGAVYGLSIPNAPIWRTWANPKMRDPGFVIFEGQAASLCKPHPIEGPYSLMKRLLGQYKGPFSDIVFESEKAVIHKLSDGKIQVTVREAWMGVHAGQSQCDAVVRYFSRKYILEPILIAFPPAVAGATYYAWKLERDSQ